MDPEPETDDSTSSGEQVRIIGRTLSQRTSTQSAGVVQLADGLCATATKESEIFGKPGRDSKFCAHRQYLLPLNSLSIRKFFRKKESFISAANKANSELIVTRFIATVKDAEWPKYQLIEIRSPTEKALDEFENTLGAMNPDLRTEKLPFDPTKYTCVQAPCEQSGYNFSEFSGGTEEEDENSVDQQSPKVADKLRRKSKSGERKSKADPSPKMTKKK